MLSYNISMLVLVLLCWNIKEPCSTHAGRTLATKQSAERCAYVYISGRRPGRRRSSPSCPFIPIDPFLPKIYALSRPSTLSGIDRCSRNEGYRYRTCHSRSGIHHCASRSCRGCLCS
ncbi:hypothetical protein K437DRAFT_76574 [Tilletiaria anomala UBC 951]|uniref:Secreted protein n=1 Tax=Tilletiaria anomala (strain ATCC 24038 / CBS 436.72 / UBC 951) TaxID=1037660 RepID=A0A066WAJ9_TILAU|nr:uncharacterized protein K437DRAFT_76574 [Tilletiaria anomala UBC 951]KDN49578.1 hypothetical protein K437DRAFT_76574 [Tilletiaria anomala UBC 951]